MFRNFCVVALLLSLLIMVAIAWYHRAAPPRCAAGGIASKVTNCATEAAPTPSFEDVMTFRRSRLGRDRPEVAQPDHASPAAGHE